MPDDSVRKESKKRPRGRPRLDDKLVPRILDAAERLFAEHGPVNVSIRDIAAEAGLPHSAIYRYFESKDEVLRRVLMRGRDRQLEHETEQRRQGSSATGRTRVAHGEQPGLHALRSFDWPSRARPLRPSASTPSGRSPAVRSPSAGEACRSSPAPTTTRAWCVAAVMALTFGWVTAEEWIIDSVGMHGLRPRRGRARRRV